MPDAFPAIITEEQFKRVREIMKENTKSYNRKPPDTNLLFYRRLFCGHCGRSLTRRKNCGGYVYFCSTKDMKDGLGCMRGSISESTVIETVLSVVRLQAKLADNVRTLKTKTAKSSSATITELRGESQSLQRLIDKSNSTKLALWEKQHAGDMTRETYQNECEKLSNQVAAYTEKIAELQARICRLEMESGQENVFVERFSKQVFIKELSRAIVEEFIEAIHVYAPDRVEIILNYADEFEKLRALFETEKLTEGLKNG